MSRRPLPPPYDARRAVRALRSNDTRLAALISEVGPFRMQLRGGMTPFHALLRAVIYQQLSGKAAASIYQRTLALFSHRHPTPQKVLQAGSEALRNAGLSRSKAVSLLDLAAKTGAGAIPSTRRLRAMPDEAIVDALTEVRGIGRWTVEMLLIFHLGRADVLPVTDLGVRKGLRHAYRLSQLPTPDQLLRYGERWRPYRSVASWYLWRANDL